MQIERNTHVVFEHTKHKKVWQVIATRIANGRALRDYHNNCAACEYANTLDGYTPKWQNNICPFKLSSDNERLDGRYPRLRVLLKNDPGIRESAVQIAEQIRDWPVKDDVICR